jgi:hypothetical protein
MFGRTLMPSEAIKHPFYREVAAVSRASDIPSHYSHPVWKSDNPKDHGDWLEAVHKDGKVSGYTLYETAAMSARVRASDGTLQFMPGYAEEIRSRAQLLGIMD